MRRAAVAWVLALSAVTARAADDLPILVYSCPRVHQAPVIDGRLDDACWTAAPVVDGFSNFYSGGLASVQTFFQCAYDDRALYFAVTCDEPTPERVARVALPRDDLAIFSHEAVEIFLDPGHTHAAFYQVGATAAGSLYDSSTDVGTRWDGGIQVAAAMGERAWRLELAIPWAGLGIAPAPGQVHGFNVCRDRYLGPDEVWSSWARVKGTFHDPIRFAHLVLDGAPDMLGRLGAELRKDERTGPLQVATAEGFGGASYRALARAALAKLDAGLAELGQVATGEASPVVRQSIQRRLDEFEAEAQAAGRTIGDERADAETLMRLEARLRQTAARLGEVVWQARLEALFAGI